MQNLVAELRESLGREYDVLLDVLLTETTEADAQAAHAAIKVTLLIVRIKMDT